VKGVHGPRVGSTRLAPSLCDASSHKHATSHAEAALPIPESRLARALHARARVNLRVRSQTGDALRAGCGVYRSIPVVVAAVLLQGCAAAGLTLLGVGVDVGADAGVTYTLDGISDRTFTDAAERVRQATMTALDEAPAGSQKTKSKQGF